MLLLSDTADVKLYAKVCSVDFAIVGLDMLVDFLQQINRVDHSHRV